MKPPPASVCRAGGDGRPGGPVCRHGGGRWGVDLRLDAGAQGFHEVLIVKTRQAAANPSLARLRFGVRASGLSLRAGEGGTVELVDAKGRVVFSSPPPAMWDAARHHSLGRFEVAPGALGVVPDRRLLADPATVFPVSI